MSQIQKKEWPESKAFSGQKAKEYWNVGVRPFGYGLALLSISDA